MSNSMKDIRDTALRIIESRQSGIRLSELQAEVQKLLPSANPNSIRGETWNIDQRFPDLVSKPSRGVFVAKKYLQVMGGAQQREQIKPVTAPVRESDFYLGFAKWLEEQEVCTKALSLGGTMGGWGKWQTPDVIGIWRPSENQFLKPATEVVSAEVKTNTSELITAFGQACAYRLFSHKSYVVIPKSASEDDKDRLDSLCVLFGLGLVLFDSSSKESPSFQEVVRPVRREPDYWHANRYLQELYEGGYKELFK